MDYTGPSKEGGHEVYSLFWWNPEQADMAASFSGSCLGLMVHVNFSAASSGVWRA